MRLKSFVGNVKLKIYGKPSGENVLGKHIHDFQESKDEEFEYVSCYSCPKVWKRQITSRGKCSA